MTSIAHREQVLLNASNCTFIVGPEKQEIRALKGVLTLVSPVFQAMFFGGLPETENILIPDVTPAAFKVLLCHAYNLPQIWNSVKEALDILYVSHKYAYLELEMVVKSYLLKNINIDTVFDILQDNVAQNTADLKDECLKFFAQNTIACLNSQKFLEIPLFVVEQLFTHKEMNISSELELFQALERYASRNELKRSDVAAEGPQTLLCLDKQNRLESLIKEIRFLSMTATEIEGISRTELINKEEKLAIYAHTVNPNSTYPIPATINKERSKRPHGYLRENPIGNSVRPQKCPSIPRTKSYLTMRRSNH